MEELAQKPNWRRAYHEMISSHIDQYRRWRWLGDMQRVRPDRYGPQLQVKDLTDSQIEALAYQEAEKDLNRAIHEWNESTSRRKRRRSEAL